MKLNNFFGIPYKNTSKEKNLKKEKTTTGFPAVDSTINRDLAKSYIFRYGRLKN